MRGRGLGDKRLLAMLVEPRSFIESKCRFVLSAGEQHDLVAILVPGVTESTCEDCPAPTLTTVRSMSHDILDYAVRAAGPRQVWNDCERTARNERARNETPKVLDSRVRKSFRPHCLGDCGRRWRVVVIVQMGIQAEQQRQVGRLEFAYVHVRSNG